MQRFIFSVVIFMWANGLLASEEKVPLQAIQATVRIYTDGQSSTGFIVGIPGEQGEEDAHLLVTARHAFHQMQADFATVAFRAQTAEGVWQRREIKIQIRREGKPIWKQHREADVGFLQVDIPKNVSCQPLALGAIATADDFNCGRIHAGRNAWVACYPAKTESNPAGWSILRSGVIASHPLVPVESLDHFFVDYSHFGGDSGAAVVIDDDGEALVVGIVVAMQRQTDRIVSPFEEKIIHRPLGLAIVVPSTLLLDLIQQWQSSPR